MKKVIAILGVLLIVAGIIYYNIYTSIRTFDMNGYLFTSDNITNNLINGEDKNNKKSIDYSKVKYNDSLYRARGTYFIGDRNKVEVNVTYPLVSRDSSTLLFLSNKGKLVDSKYRKSKTYSNSLISDNKLFNENDYERADNLIYYFVELDNSIFIALSEMTIKCNDKEYTIPVNSFISFSENSLRYYYLDGGKYYYKEIKGLNENSTASFLGKKYKYMGLLELLGLFIPEEEVPEIEFPPLIEEEEVIVEEEVVEEVVEPTPSEPLEYVKPTVSFSGEEASVYSFTGKLEVKDPTNQITKYPTFEFWKGKTMYVRKSFVGSDKIEVKGLLPDTEYEVIGTFQFKNKEGQEVRSEFTRFKITTQDLSKLESVDIGFGDIIPSYNSCEFTEIRLNNKESDEVLKGIKKIVLNVGNSSYQLGAAMVSKLLRFEPQKYATSTSLISNTKYEVTMDVYDVANNKLNVVGGKASFKTTKQAPTGSLAVKSREISKAVLQFNIINKDNINITNMHYVVYDSQRNMITDTQTDSYDATLNDLLANEIYSVYLFGDYDLEDGKGIQKDVQLVEGKFSTEPLSTLGYVKIVFDDINADRDNISFKLKIGDETNERLRELLSATSIVMKRVSDNEVVQELDLSDSNFTKLVGGEYLSYTVRNLDSNSGYYFELVSYVDLGNKRYEIKTLCNVNIIKTLRKDAEVQIFNKFITEKMIDFDVKIFDPDGSIQSNRVLMEVRDHNGVLVYYEELGINDDFRRITIDKLTKDEYYTFSYKVEEYNIGHDNRTFETNKTLFEERIVTEEGLSGKIEIENLLKQITSKNIFDINNNRRWKTAGDRDVSRRRTDLTENILYLGAKNGYRSYSYYLPEYAGKQITVSFNVKYADNNTKQAYLCPGTGNCTTYPLNNVTNTDWTYIKQTLTVTASNPYITFNIRETNGENNITTLMIKELQFESGANATSYAPYKEKEKMMGKFLSTLNDKNHEVPEEDFHYYLRYYKNDKLVDTVQFDFNDSYHVEKELSEHEIDKSADYNVKLSIRKRIINVDTGEDFRFYDLANLNFTSDDEIRSIHSVSEFYTIHTSGFYLVAEDLDFSNQTGTIGSTFNGIIDFQGHKVIRDISRDGASAWSAKYLFHTIGSNGVIKNIDAHYYFDGNAIGDYNGFAYYQYGTIENIKVTLEQGNNKPNVVISLIARENYGIVKNFVVHCKESLSIERDGSLVVLNNRGTIMNGYLYGAAIDGTNQNNSLQGKYIGGVARWAGNNSFIANIYSLIDVNIGETQTSAGYQNEVGNIIGPADRSIVRNVYTYSEGTNRNKSKDLNIWSGTMSLQNVYYATLNDYSGAYSNKISPNTLRQETFQNILNANGAFDIKNYVKYGYFPHLLWPDVMPNQDYIELPREDDGKIDFLNLESVKENDDQTVEAIMIFQNPGYDDITSLGFKDGLKADILDQESFEGKTRLKVKLYNPTTYKSKYSLLRITHRNSANFEGTPITYGDLERIVEVDMYRNVHNVEEFNTIKTNAAQNYKLQADIDFSNVNFTVGTFTGKLDGNGHTISNIREVDNNFINLLRGGTLKNIYIENYYNSGNGTGSGTASYGGFIGQADQSATIDNVHMKNVSVTDRNTYAGGLVGYTNGIMISNSSLTDVHIYQTNKNNIRYYGRYGGMIGENNNTLIQNSFVQGLNMEIIYGASTYGIGGLIGRQGSGYVQDCYVEGIIDTNQQEVGGVVGYNNGYIERVISDVFVYTKQDSVGGVVGYSTNDSIFNTLVLGGVYSYKTALNQNRTVGNRTAVNSNYAWNEQLVNGLNANTANGDIFLSTEDLQSFTVFESLVKLGDHFDLSKLVNSQGHNVVPKLKYFSGSGLLPNQKDIEYYVDDFKVTYCEIEKSVSDASIYIHINNPDNRQVKDVEIEGLDIRRILMNDTREGETLYAVQVLPERYYDSYLIKSITYVKAGKDIVVHPAAKIDLTFYKDIGTFEDWQKIDGDIYENYRLVNDIDFNGKTNVKTRVSFNRLEGTDGGHSLKNITFSANSGHVGLIDTVASNISNVTFDGITINSTSSEPYTGIIRFLNGTMYDVNFNNIIIKSKGSYVGAVAYNQSPDIKRISIDTATVNGASRVGGFIGRSRYFDITHVTAQHLNITGTSERVGGIMGEHDHTTYPTMFNFTVNDATVKGTNYVGGVQGLGGCNMVIATNVNVTGNSYVGGLSGQAYFTYLSNGYLQHAVVIGSGENIGGAYGYSYDLRYVYVDDANVKATRSGNYTNRVGGLTGRSSYTRYYCGVRNSVINNLGNYTGGLTGQLENAGLQTSYVYNTKVTGRQYVGGMVGFHSSTSSSIYYCISNATVTATVNNAGGIIGYMDNLNTTSASNIIRVYRNVVAGSKITSSGNLAGAISANSNKLPFDGHFYDNFIVADITTSGGQPYQFFIGNDDVNLFNASALRAVRVYEGSTYNGQKIKELNVPSNIKKYTLDNLKVQATFKDLLRDTFNYTQITNGKYPYLTYQWNNSGIQYFDLPTASSASFTPTVTGSTKSSNLNTLPTIKVYSSDVDKINVEFSKVVPGVTFKINNTEYSLEQLSYTFYYDYLEDFSILVSDSQNTKEYKFKADDLRGYSSITDDNYYFIDGEEIVTNDKELSLKMSDDGIEYKVLLLAYEENNSSLPVNIYQDKVLLANKNVYDLEKKTTIENHFDNLTLANDTSLYEFQYGNNKIETYYNYSVINGEVVTKQVYVKDNNLEVIDSSLNNRKNNILLDGYNGKSHLIYLGNDGVLYSLKDNIIFPKNFLNRNIQSISSDVYNDSNLLFVRYNNSDYVVFNYRNGNVLKQSISKNNDLLSYFTSHFTNSPTVNMKYSDYQDSLDLINKIEKKDFNSVLGIDEYVDGGKKSSSLDKYTSVYNPATLKYEVIQIPNIDELNNDDSLNDYLSKSSTSNKISNNLTLYSYYIGAPRRNQRILLSVALIVGGLFIGIIVGIFVLKRNIRRSEKL